MDKHSDDLWIEKVKRFCEEEKAHIHVPLTALSRACAVKLAVKLNLTVLIEGSNYIFTTNKDATQAQLRDADTLH